MAVVYVDQEEWLKRMMNNKKLYIKLLTKFRNEINLSELLRAVEAKDCNKAEEAAHTIKGVSGNLSFTALYEKSAALDAQLKNNIIDMDAVDDIVNCFNETQKVIDGVLAANG
ncbi:MAG: Hpt domain-containing protein [Treponema sp.]|jgi:HPt (histidine-containing phosphotransfer) domain-containing protein|nr:Hpt domain-containing protein [Treponema sp.]